MLGGQHSSLGEQIIENPRQVPVEFEIEYDPADIDERLSYANSAESQTRAA